MKTQIFSIILMGVAIVSNAQTPLQKANVDVETAMKKMRYDFPKEKINGKNGAGYSLRPELLEKPVKKVALITFFVEDVGMSKENEMINMAKAWRSSDALAQTFADKFYEQGFETLKKSFADSDMEILMPSEYLDTPEKKEYYDAMRIRHSILKKQRIGGASASVSSSSSMGLGGGWVQTTTSTISASVNRIRVTPTGTGLKSLFFLNEAPYTKKFHGDPKPMSLPVIGLYDKMQAEHLGLELPKTFDVDAVLAVYVVVNKMHQKKEIYAVRSITGYMWGPNPIQREEGKTGLIYTRGLLYCGARAFYGKGLIFKDEKKYPEFDYSGFENAMGALGKRITHYLTTGKRK